MKNFKHYLFTLVAFVAGLVVVSCTEPAPEPTPSGKVSVNVEVANVGPASAKFDVLTSGIKSFSYLLSDVEAPATAILASGQKVNIEATDVETKSEVTVSGLDAGNTYTVYFAFQPAAGGIYEEVMKVEFTTVAYTDTVTVVDTMYDGYEVHLDIPAEVIERGNAIRYTTATLPMYNYQKQRDVIEADMLLTNAGQYTTKSRNITYDEYHSVERDEDGDPMYDAEGYVASFCDPMTPGEPCVFLAGEFSWYTLQEFDPELGEGHEDTGPYGWGEGYYVAAYDWERWYDEFGMDGYDSEKYWTGYYERVDVECKSPSSFDGKVDIRVYDKTPIDAIIQFTPSEDVVFYCVLLLEEGEYEATVLPLINNREDYMQWFTGSYFALYNFAAQTYNEPKELYLTDWFVNTKGFGGKTIRVFVTAMGNNEGNVQCFTETSFTLPEVELPAPEIEVTAVPSDDPFSVTFNVRATNQPITEAYFACNYVREFNTILKEYTYLSLLQQMGNAFGPNEIEQINSEKGFNMTWPSRDNATTRIAVLAYNWEGTGNNPNEVGSKAVCDYTTPHANYPERVESELFTTLVGEWEATAPMKTYELNDDNTYKITDAGNYTSKVVISGGVEYPETLSEEVYAVYEAAGVSRSDTEALFEEFKELADQYNRRTRGFNRLLCLGYNFADKAYMLDMIADPWDLFTDPEFNFSEVSHIFYDFGPKWNLEIDKDGSVWLPLDIEREFPMETFNFGMDYTFYMLGVGQYSFIGADIYDTKGNVILDARFPVEVSEDGNTVTINPIVYTDSDGDTETYYPCVAQLSMGYASPVNPRVAGPIVMKRKGASTAAVNSNQSVGRVAAPAVESLGEAPVPMARPRSMTNLDASKMRVYERAVIENPIETGEAAFHERMERYAKEVYGITFKDKK